MLFSWLIYEESMGRKKGGLVLVEPLCKDFVYILTFENQYLPLSYHSNQTMLVGPL